MALVAAPFRILSATTHIFIPLSTLKSLLILPTKTSSFPVQFKGIGYSLIPILSTTDTTVDNEKDYLKYLTWISSNEDVATVKDGVVVGEKAGRVTITVREMSEILGLSRRGVEEQIKSLKQKGVIRRIGPDKGGHWEVIK